MEGERDIVGVNRHQGEKYRSDIVCLALSFDLLQILDDFVRGNTGIAQAVGTRQNQKVVWVEEQHVLIETVGRKT